MAIGHKFEAKAQDIIRGCAWGKPVGQESPLNPRLRDANFMLTITIPLPYHYHYGIKPLPQPWPWPRAMALPRRQCLGHGTSKISKGEGQHASAQTMAQDIRYPWVRVGEACGPQLGLYPGVEGRKIYAYHYHTITIPYHMGLSHWAKG